MKTVHLAVLTSSALLLGGCGGGGGGAPAAESLAPTVAITSGNQSSVARVAIDGGRALGQAPLASDRVTAQSAGALPATSPIDTVRTALRRGVAVGFAPQRSASTLSAERPAAVSSATTACVISGTGTRSWDDRDGSQTLSAGDTLSIAFDQCKDTAGELISGAMVFTVGHVVSASDFSATLAFQQVVVTEGMAITTISGTVGVSLLETAAVSTLSMMVGGDGFAVVSAGPGFADSIFYDPAMQIDLSTYASPAREAVALNGSFSASSIGGRVWVQTVTPVTQLAADLYPSSGQVLVTGVAGSRLRISVLDSTQLELELDANGDAAYEGSLLVDWAALRPA